MPTLDVKVNVVKTPDKPEYCAWGGVFQNDEDFQVGDAGFEGDLYCARSRSSAIAGALSAFAKYFRANKPFGGLPARCRPFTPAALRKGTKIEHREHPEFAVSTARRIARDHLCRNPNAYKKER